MRMVVNYAGPHPCIIPESLIIADSQSWQDKFLCLFLHQCCFYYRASGKAREKLEKKWITDFGQVVHNNAILLSSCDLVRFLPKSTGSHPCTFPDVLLLWDIGYHCPLLTCVIVTYILSCLINHVKWHAYFCELFIAALF